MSEKRTQDSFAQILLDAKIVEPAQLDEALKTAKRLDVPLQNALAIHKHGHEKSLQAALCAHEMVEQNKISTATAVRALVLAQQNNIDLDDAVNVIGSVISQSQKSPALTNPLTELLLNSKLADEEQLLQSMKQAQEAKMLIGQCLVINRLISRTLLFEMLTALMLVKEGKIAKGQAEQALILAMRRKVGVVQILFELGQYKDFSGQTLKLSELIDMAQLLSHSDFLACLEISVCEDKSFQAVILEKDLLTNSLLEAALLLLDMISNRLKPFQAAEALRQVRAKNIPSYQAASEVQALSTVPDKTLRLGDLLVEAGLLSYEAVESALKDKEASAIRIGKRLMSSGLVSEACLYKALRCQSLLKEGLLSQQQAVAILQASKDDNVTLEETLAKAGCYVPARMHWSWV